MPAPTIPESSVCSTAHFPASTVQGHVPRNSNYKRTSHAPLGAAVGGLNSALLLSQLVATKKRKSLVSSGPN